MLSKHHYAIELARRGNDVIFIEPWHPGKILAEVNEHPGIRLFPWRTFRGLRKIPPMIGRQLSRREMLKISSMSGGIPDVIWSFDNSRFFDLNVLNENVYTIHHMVDLNQDFELARAASSAKMCLATTQFIDHRLRPYNTNTHNIGHGCDLQTYPAWQKKEGKIKIVYAGNLLIPLLDRARILKAVERFDGAEFIFAGAYDAGAVNKRVNKEAKQFVDELRAHENVTLTGPLVGEAYHSLLSSADLFILAYSSDHYEQVANPHKIPEFLSTGRAIISNVLDSYKDTGLVEMADDEETWMELLGSAIQHVDDYNAPSEQKKRREWAEAHSYQKQVERIESLIR